MNCKICNHGMARAFQAKVLRKHDVSYFHCVNCGLLQTEEPYWLEEAYGSAIADADTGLVQRNLYLSKILSTILYFAFDRDGKYLDVAGGYGMLTRLMRDTGFDFYWSDKYCENVLARGFEAEPGAAFTAMTAFEVMEHVPDPLGFVTECMAQSGSRTLIFSTELFEGAPPKPEEWWYYTFETGQHITFYQRRSLQAIAQKLGLHCYSNGLVHAFSDRKINGMVYRLLSSPVFARVLSLAPKFSMQSKTMTDHLDMIGRHR